MRIERLLSPTTRSVAALRGRGGPTLALGRRSRAIYVGGLALFWMFVVLAPARAQEAESTEPFFSVSSQQTYAPAQQPKIWIQFRQVDRLDFRIYRVKDPVQFFSKLRDAHSFGGEKHELAREKTWLERFHNWKRDLRLAIRDFFRLQLRFETRARYHSARVREQKLKRVPLDVTSYAQVPLLNREQLVLSWRELLPLTRDSEYREIPVDLHQKGLFLVEVAHRELRAYTLLMITDLALVSKSAPGQILLFVAQRGRCSGRVTGAAAFSHRHFVICVGARYATPTSPKGNNVNSRGPLLARRRGENPRLWLPASLAHPLMVQSRGA